MKFLIAVFVALAAVAAADVPFTVCGSQPQVMTVSTLSVQPFPAVAGQNVNVTLIGSGSSSLTAGKYSIQADYMGIAILTQTGDVCTLDPAHPCPMTAGPIAISHVLPVPSIAPAGQYDISISSTDQNGNTVVCLNFALTIGSGNSLDDNDDAGLDFEILEPSIAMPEQDAADLPSTDMPAPEQPEQEQDEQPVQEEEEQEEQEPEQQEEEDGLIEEEQPEEPIAEEEQPEEEQEPEPEQEQEPEQQEEEEDGLIEEDLPNNAAPEDDDSIPMEDGEEAEEPAGDDEEESDQQPVAEDSDEGEVPPADREEDEEDQDEDDEQEVQFAPKNNEWKSCGDASYTFTVTSITTPDGAPVPGKQFTILVEGDLSSEITGGTVTLKTSYDGIPVSSDNSNFCDAVANTTACPWQVGKQSLRSVSVIPDTTPSGDYVETLTAVDQNNKNVMCITGTFTI